MGNSLNFKDHADGSGPGEAVKFFLGIRLQQAKWVFSKIQASMLSDFDMSTQEILTWRQYFQLFSELKDNIDVENEQIRKSNWHTACQGYEMERKEFEMPRVPTPKEAGKPDYYTDDDLTDDEENVNEMPTSSSAKKEEENSDVASDVSKEPKKTPPPPHLDPQLISPIFFGYSMLKTKEKMAMLEEKKESLKIAEERAITNAKEMRSNIIDSFEKQISSQESVRLKKIGELETKYEAASKKREEEYERNQRELPPVAFKLFKAQWESEYDAAELAFDTEIEGMKKTHSTRTSADQRELRRRREELEAFKDLNAQEVPAAERLEEIARVEIGRWIDEVNSCGKELERARQEYKQVREEMEEQSRLEEQARQANPGGKPSNNNKSTAALKLRSMTNIAGTAVREAQKKLEDAIQSLNDAEILLQRAIRMKLQQDAFLPFFALLAKAPDGALPKECELNLFVASLTTIVMGTFSQKLNFIMSLYDRRADGLFDAKFLGELSLLFQKAFIRMNYLSVGITTDQMNNVMERGFFDLGLHPSRDFLTQFEAKEFLSTLISKSGPINQVLGNVFGNVSAMSTYQRNRLGPVARLCRGMIGPTICKYQVHFESIRYRPQLSTERKQIVHEKSMTMGAEDPLKPDYSKFIGQPKKKSKTPVVPLEHGHLMNIRFKEQKLEFEAAVMIQSMYRTRREIRNAELAARKQAFDEAKELAMKEMRDKVVREFRAREASSGVGKMKWDAQVRMRQAKLRAAGQQVSRSDMVMIMMEETINQAKSDIEERFRKIEQNEQFAGVNFEKKDRSLDDPAKQLDIGQLFGLFSKKNQDSDALTGTVDISTPRPDDDEESTPATVVADGGEAAAEADAQQRQLAFDRTQQIIEGRYFRNPLKDKGETRAEADLREIMAMPEPEPKHYLSRLRALHVVVTLLKASRLISEIPSKRLLLKYVEHHRADSLASELLCHFGFIRGAEELGATLKCIVRTDLERGVLMSNLRDLQEEVESGLRYTLTRQMLQLTTSLNDTIDRKINASELTASVASKEHSIFQIEIERVENNRQKFQASCDALLANMMLLRSRFFRNMLSCAEAERKRRAVHFLQRKRKGHVSEVQISAEDRFQWCKRLQIALRWDSEKSDPLVAGVVGITPDENLKKHSEIRNVCREFLDIVRADAAIIVAEHNQPKYLKTIPVVSETKVQGRSEESGRGFDGFLYTYEAHNIQYTVCADYHGIFNGSDEYAAKSVGSSRIASLEFFKTHTPQFTVPMIATVDIFGYRVQAMAKPPVERITYSDDGEVRKITEELVHGIVKDGDNFINKNKVLQRILKIVAQKLNLCEHEVKGFKDIASSKTFGPSELKIYRGDNDEFYATDFFRSFPSETPEDTTHLFRSPRDQSIFWRLLRPEFCRHFETPLSPDAASLIVEGVKDRVTQYNSVQRATQHLIQKTIPAFVEDLIHRTFLLKISDGLGLDFSTDLHSRGINIRHLGLIRSLLWRPLPGTINIYYNDQFIRTSRDLRQELRNGDRIRIEGAEYVVEESPKNKFSAKTVPLSKVYLGDSKNRITATIGFTSTDKNSDTLRTVLLCEMIVRAIKSTVRLHLRNYAKKESIISTTFAAALYCEYLNVVTGASKRANVELQEVLYHVVREKFGPLSIRPSEQLNLQSIIEPCTIFMIRRLQYIFGVRLSISSTAEFLEHPIGFVFSPTDFMEVAPMIRHNIPVLALSEATLLGMKAAEAEEEVYLAQVQRDRPTALFRLSERKGSRSAENISFVLGCNAENKHDKNLVAGAIIGHMELEQSGPIKYEPFIRSVKFLEGGKAYIETKYHPLVVPTKSTDHFSVEVFCKCTGGHNSARTVFMSGRYGLVISRDNHWNFVIMEGMHDLNMRIAKVEYDKWFCFVATFDGVTVRCFVDGVMIVSLETEELMKLRAKQFEQEIEEKKQDLIRLEAEERSTVKHQSQLESEQFFQTKAGVYAIKKAVQNILESQAFQSENIETTEDGKPMTNKQKRVEATKTAKQNYAVDLYVRNVRIVADKYKQLNEELKDSVTKKIEEGELRSRKGVRIGAALAGSISKDIKATFIGYVSCFSAYHACLAPDRVRAHYLAAVADKTKQIKRLYAETAIKYEEAISFAPDDPLVLKGYAKALCQYLRVELASGADPQGIIRGKFKIREAIQAFRSRNLAEGIGHILVWLPRDPEFADLVCYGIRTILATDRTYFAKGFDAMSRKDVIWFPRDFGLNIPTSPQEFIDVAAILYREVMKEIDLRFSYGEVELGWISDLQCPELVVCLVNYACEHSNLKFMKVGEILQKAGRQSTVLSDGDVDILSRNLLTSIGFDFSGCGLLTNHSTTSLTRLRAVRYINLDGCALITDSGVGELALLAECLEGLSFARLTLLTDTGILALALKCSGIKSLNVSNCPNITANSLVEFAKKNQQLAILKLSATSLTDNGLSQLSAQLSKEHLTQLDISFCREVTDYGVVSLSQACANLRFLNLCGNHRITDEGIRNVTTNCWFLQDLNIEDLYLLNDQPFWYNVSMDGRVATNENMLKSLVSVNLKDCVNITDHALFGLAERCRSIESLVLRGCDKLGDGACSALADPAGWPNGIPLCDSLKSLDVAYCQGLTATGVLKFLPYSGVLENLDVSGICTINDSFIHQLCLVCRTIQRLKLQKCVQVSDVALCSMAESLWVEELNITGCHRITSEGIEILTVACNGIKKLICRKVFKLTESAVNSVIRNCKIIEELDVSGCPLLVDAASFKELLVFHPHLKLSKE